MLNTSVATTCDELVKWKNPEIFDGTLQKVASPCVLLTGKFESRAQQMVAGQLIQADISLIESLDCRL